jgi:hypothetical protein
MLGRVVEINQIKGLIFMIYVLSTHCALGFLNTHNIVLACKDTYNEILGIVIICVGVGYVLSLLLMVKSCE